MSQSTDISSATRSLFERAGHVTPGGVHSPVRAFSAMGVSPLAIVEARGARVRDVEGREYVDWIGAWGPALLGHAAPGAVQALQKASQSGLLFGLASPGEVALAERITSRVPGCEMVRFVASGTEAAMSALRLARAAKERSGVIKFAGCYHGHADSFLVSAGSGAATFGTPNSPGVTQGAAGDTAVARFNDLESVDRAFAERPGEIAAVFVEPVPGNMGCIPPEHGFLPGLRERCDREGALLVFDEIITGFRVGRAGVAERFGVTPDLVLLGKALGGGTPLAAFGGRRDVMRLVSPAGPVYQAGTYAAHPLSIAAALATLDAIDADASLYDRLEATSTHLAEGLDREARAAVAESAPPFRVQRVASMWTPFFSSSPVRSWDDAEAVDREAHARFFAGMLERGVLLPPSAFESAFVSASHTDDDVAFTLDAARGAFREAWS